MKRSLTLAQYFLLSRLAGLGLAMLLIGSSGGCPIWEAGVIGALSFLVMGAEYSSSRRSFLPPRWLLFVALGGATLAGWDRYSHTKDIAYLFGYVLPAWIPIAARSRDARTGHWMSLLMVFLTAVIALLTGNELAQYLIFFAFAAAAVFWLNAGHLYFHVGESGARRGRVPEGYFLPFVLSVSGGMSVGALLFFFFPRSFQWQNPFGLRSQETVTGYTGIAALQGAGPQSDTTLAMLVEADDSDWLKTRATTLRFRGNTLDYFDGIHWTNSANGTTRFQDPTALRYTNSVERIAHRLHIYREPHSPPAIVYPGVLGDITAPWDFLGGLRIDGLGNLLRHRPGFLRYSYGVNVFPIRPSRATTISLAEVRERWKTDRGLKFVPAGDRNRFLRLPAELSQADFFQKWLREIHLDEDQTSVGVLLARLQSHFAGKFTAISDAASATSLEEFLTTRRRGHCEYFATAAVLFLRAHGVPARLALGYLGGAFNPVSHVLEVRESDAHAWAEVYLPGTGWETYDPTPGGAELATTRWFNAFRNYAGAAKYWFERYVIDYNAATQLELARDFSVWKRNPRGKTNPIWRETKPWLALVLAVSILALAWFFRRRKNGSGRRADLPDYYRLFDRRLRARGLCKGRSETFLRFHQRVKAAGIPENIVDRVHNRLERDLYHRSRVSTSSSDLVREIRQL